MHAAVEACCVTGAGLGQQIALLTLNGAADRTVRGCEASISVLDVTDR